MKKYKSLFLSDIHLGSSYCNSSKLFKLLKEIEIENLFLLGDVFNRNASKNSKDILEFQKILASKEWNIVYILGNHEKERSKAPIDLLNLKRYDEYIYKNSYLIHGDSFHDKDIFNKILKYLLMKIKKLAKVKMVKEKRKERIKSTRATLYHTKVKPLMQKVLLNSYTKYLTSLAKKRGLKNVICGHIHLPQDQMINGIRYLNCGDWITHNSYIVEDLDGNLKLIT